MNITPHDNPKGREGLEWSNFWYSQTNHTDQKKRILMIGDSTVRMIRSTFERESGYPVDMLGTSSGLHDILFLSQLDAFFVQKSYKYSDVYVQMGHHSITNDDGNDYTASDYRRYKDDLIWLVDYLKKAAPGANIVLLTSFLNVMPVRHRLQEGLAGWAYRKYIKLKGETYDESWNKVVREKNKIVKEVSEELHMPFCDIEGYMQSLKKFVHKDHIHYEDRAKPTIAKAYMKYLS